MDGRLGPLSLPRALPKHLGAVRSSRHPSELAHLRNLSSHKRVPTTEHSFEAYPSGMLVSICWYPTEEGMSPRRQSVRARRHPRRACPPRLNLLLARSTQTRTRRGVGSVGRWRNARFAFFSRLAFCGRCGCRLPEGPCLSDVVWLASSSSQRSAAGRAQPPPDQLSAFYKLVDKTVIAGTLCRHARVVELSASAAVQAEALFGGDDSLVVANLRMCESQALTSLAIRASGAERAALFRRSWAVLVSVVPLLLRRMEANTLLPGTIKEEELDYYAHAQAAAGMALDEPVLSPAALRAAVTTIGYNTLLDALYRSLDLLRDPNCLAAHKKMVESFVLQGLEVIPLTASTSTDLIAGEESLVTIVEEDVNPRNYGSAFCASVLRKWRSNAVRSVLQARGVLQTGIADSGQDAAEFDARQRADIAKHGLRDCALPSCSKTEKTVKEFAGCTGCRSVVYCCLEHQALDWRAHKKACREKEAARLAADEEADDGAGARAAAA